MKIENIDPLIIILSLYSTGRWLRFHRGCLLRPRMNTALVRDESDCDQNENDDEHYALFIRRKFENPEKPFHFFA